jgi:Na+-transporting NADH:ubiquinone oxidoreductase subunit NqrB
VRRQALAGGHTAGAHPAQRARPPLRARLAALVRCDARLYQVVFLALLLGTGVLLRDFSLQPAQVALTFAAGIATQLFWVRRLGLSGVGVLSALITCFGLSVLLRADGLWAHPLAAAACLSAKFVLRVNGKHLFNPGNLGVVLGVLLLPGAWVSPGQWGSDLLIACWLIALGGAVAGRARSINLSLAFLAFFLGAYALRIVWLGQSWSVFAHLLQNGALLMFAFFMISDPMTAPNRNATRLLYAACVAALAFVWQFALFMQNGPIWALFLCAPLVPLFDRLWPGERPVWRREPATARALRPGPAR